MSTVHLPPAGEPDPAVAAVREELDAARAERREVSRRIALLAIPSGRTGPGYLQHRGIRLRAAEHELGLWSDECRRLESKLRSLGVRP